MQFLLDTNILSDLVRHPQGVIANRILAVGETRVCTSIIVAAEFALWRRQESFDTTYGPS
jgi:tRNA(fMet)-specific endonuclease VapC